MRFLTSCKKNQGRCWLLLPLTILGCSCLPTALRSDFGVLQPVCGYPQNKSAVLAISSTTILPPVVVRRHFSRRRGHRLALEEQHQLDPLLFERLLLMLEAWHEIFQQQERRTCVRTPRGISERRDTEKLLFLSRLTQRGVSQSNQGGAGVSGEYPIGEFGGEPTATAGGEGSSAKATEGTVVPSWGGASSVARRAISSQTARRSCTADATGSGTLQMFAHVEGRGGAGGRGWSEGQ